MPSILCLVVLFQLTAASLSSSHDEKTVQDAKQMVLKVLNDTLDSPGKYQESLLLITNLQYAVYCVGCEGCCPVIAKTSSLIRLFSGYRVQVSLIISWGTCSSSDTGYQ